VGNTMLQKFLDVGLLDVGDDNSKFEYLEKAADDIAKTLKRQKRMVVRSTLLVMRERLPDGDPITSHCEEMIKKHWPTYRGRFKDDTNQLYRATLLQAIDQVCASDIHYAAAVYYIGISLLPYLAHGQEHSLFYSFLIKWGEAVEAKAALAWARPDGSAAKEIHFDEIDFTPSPLNAKWLAGRLRAAIGVSGEEKANAEWPSSNSTTWLNHFGLVAAEAIRDATTASLKTSAELAIAQIRADITQVIEAYLTTMQSPETVSEIRRTDLLYWKETLYSPTQKSSYRAMSAENGAFWMAVDLHTQMPLLHTHSIEFFLRETLFAAFGEEARRKYSLSEFSASIGPFSLLSSQNISNHSETGVTLLDFVQMLTAKQATVDDVEVLMGIPSTAPIQLDDAAVWLFRDLQSRRISGGK